MNRLIIAGSPKVNGRTGALAHLLFEACIEECPEDELAWVPVSEVVIDGCYGCGHCAKWAHDLVHAPEAADAQDGEDVEAPAPRCCIEDDMIDLYELIDAADELTIVSPVYFAGPPSQLKALLDRMQPYYYLNIDEGAGAGVPKRPAILHVVGEGGDPHGFDALVTIVKSALAVSGFALETVYDWVGKIDANGEIQEEATVYDLTGEAAPEDFDESDFVAFAYEEDEEPAKPQLRLNDQQVVERGRQSAEQGRRPDKTGKTERRQGKGNNQTNNRNKRKENQSRRASDGRNTGPKSSSGRRQGSGGKGSGSGSGSGSKGGKRRG